ncbi:MAG: 4Fe-4S binding protein [Chloroflexi bacterium]|nr:4Fe-4S binding protein [Chloroflexota bacterium]
MDAHYHLAQKLNTHAIGAPERAEFLEILHMLFTTDEADVALHLGWKPEPVTRIAEKAGLAVDEALARCESMANKGLVYAYSLRERRLYALLPSAPGLFEYPLMIGHLPGVDMDRLGELWTQYYENGWGHELHGAPTDFARVLPHSGSIAETVTVLPFEEATKYVDEAQSISLTDCPCRKAKKACDKPLDVCLAFGYAAEFMSERKAARLIDREEARAVLTRAEDAGLVHCSSNTLNKVDFICNCCSCCCGILGAASRLKDAASRPHSNFYSTVDAEACTNCTLCEDRCPVHAISLDGVAVVDQSRCIGCGLCASACPYDAVHLQRKMEVVPPADAATLFAQIAEEKGRRDAFLAGRRAS